MVIVIPAWVLWTLAIVVALPIVYFVGLFLLFLGASGEYALRRDAERAAIKETPPTAATLPPLAAAGEGRTASGRLVR